MTIDESRRVPYVPPQNREPYNAEHGEYFDRRLGRPQLAAIGISGTIGVGLFITTGESISLAGSLGATLAYLCASITVAAVFYTLAEMVSARPVTGALIDFPNKFCSAELGFAVGVTYWIAETICMAVLNAATARIADEYGATSLDPGKRTGLVIGLVVITALSNLIGVRLYGQLERIVAFFKMSLILLLAVLMIGVNFGLGGSRTGSRYGNFTELGIVPAYRPDGFDGTLEWNIITDNRAHEAYYGIPSKDGGRLFAVLTAITLAIFSCMGGDQVIMTAGEARDPWNDLPAVTKLIYWIPLLAYPILTMLVGFNINYGDPDLYKPWAKFNTNVSHSPFIIATRYGSFGALPTALNTFFLLSGYTCGNTALYVSSRTLFIVAQNYGKPWMRNFFGKTNDGKTPQNAIIFTSAFGLVGLLGIADTSFNQPILTMSALFTGGVGCIYAAQCWSFFKFKAGLDSLHRRGIFSRDDELYKKHLFRGYWQPFIAGFGLFGSLFVVVFAGFPSIYLLCARGGLKTKDDLKGSGLLAADIIGAYAGPVLFVSLYYGRRLVCGSKPRDPTKFHITAYVLPDTDKFEQGQRVMANADSSVRSGSSVGSTILGSNSGAEMSDLELLQSQIEGHLIGHGRIPRACWMEIWMLVWDCDRPKKERAKKETEASEA